MAASRGCWSAITVGYLVWSLLPVLIAVAVLVQRRPVPHHVAGLLVPLVLGRPDAVGLARRRAAHRAAPDPQAGRDHDADHRAARGRCSRSASTAGAGGCPAGANFLMLLSFVLPEMLLAVALLFVITTVALPVELGTTAQVIGLVTFQVSYPAVLVRARLATIGTAIRGSRNGPRRVAARRAAPGHPADADAGDLRQHRAGLRRRDRRLRAGALPVGRRRRPSRCR